MDSAIQKESPTSDPKSNLWWKYDSIHGFINTKDEFSLFHDNSIEKLLKSKAIQRLRRIKQLGFASLSYTSADHSRYSHVLGTLHMMRTILNHLSETKVFQNKDFSELSNYFSITLENDVTSFKIIAQHMLVASILQDTGELPYLQSTRHVFKPNRELRKAIENAMGIQIENLSNKSIFTVGCIFNDEITQYLQGYSVPFLIWLITGLSNKHINRNASFQSLRHLVDGVCDADRLDYVYRDAHATIGNTGFPTSVIESLMFYDKDGPVFSDPNAVSNFLMTRAHLYSTVYLDPTNRFYTLLLVNFLKGIAIDSELSKKFYKNDINGELSLEDFLELDDISLFSRINVFAEDVGVRKLNQKARIALELLTDKQIDYTCFWLPVKKRKSHERRKVILPDELFFDTFNDQKRYLYQEKSVRIKADRFKNIGQVIPLEDCEGPLSSMFKEKLVIVPMMNKIMMYIPKKIPPKSIWSDFEKIINGGEIDVEITENDVLTEINPFARNTENILFERKYDVFMCYNSINLATVKRIGNSLRKKGISPWLDNWELSPGTRWQKLLQTQIDNIKSVAVFIGPDGNGPWQDLEIEAFLIEFVKRGCKIIPVILKGCNSEPKMPLFLGSITFVNFNKKTPNPIDNLIWGLKS